MSVIGIDIDVNTTSVNQATHNLDKMNAQLLDAKGNVIGSGSAAKKAAVDFTQFANAIEQITERSRKAAQEAQRLEQASHRIGSAQRQLRFVVQNTSFQLADMAVQFQMGTNAAVILAQQLPQVAAGFGVVGAVIGTILAVGIPVASFFFDFGRGMKSAKEEADQLADSANALIAINSKLAQTNEELSGSYGTNVIAMRQVLQLQAEMARFDFAQQLREQISAISALFDMVAQKGTAVIDASGFAQITLEAEELRNSLGKTAEESESMMVALRTLQGAHGFQEQAVAANRLAESIAESAGGAEKLEGKAAETYRQLLAIVATALETQASIEAAAGSAGGLADATSRARQEAYSLSDAWSGVVGQVRQAQVAALRARIELNTRNNPIGRAGALAGLGFDQEVEGVKKAIVTPADLARLQAARNETVKWREEEARLREESARLDEFTGKISRSIDSAKDATEKTGKAMKDTAKAARDIVEPSKQFLDMIKQSEQATQGIVAALKGVAFGTVTGSEGVGGVFQAITDKMFGQTMDDAFNKAANTLSDAIKGALSQIGASTTDFGVASIGTGIGIAATGVLTGNAQQIGSGVGSAIGGYAGAAIGTKIGGMLGSVAGPVGMALGAVAGGFIANLFGKGDDDKWKEVTGRAFTGTTYEFGVNTRGTVNTQTDQGFSPEGRFAFDGLVRLTNNFNREIKQFVKAAGGEVQAGLNLVVDQHDVIMGIAGRTKDLPYKGEEGKRFGEMISQKVGEIMALAGQVAAKAGPALTQAQQIWRQTQKQFSKDNVEILKDLGFSAKQISEAMQRIKTDLIGGFNLEMADALVTTGHATKENILLWQKLQLEALQEQYVAAYNTAKEIGASIDLVKANFAAQKKTIADEVKDMLERMGDAAREALQNSIGRYTEVLGRYEQRRSEILNELARRSEEARSAEQALLEARRGLVVSDLAPGSPMSRLSALQSQFNNAINSAKGGNTQAATLAAQLAQELLQQGQQVYASGGAYSSLFKGVNAQLLEAQLGFGKGAAALEKRLDAETFTDITEKSTKALLLGLSSVNASIKTTNAKIEELTKRLAASEAKKRVA